MMKKRYLYALLFGIPGLFGAGITSLLFFGAVIGVLWLFIFGDNPWPVSVEQVFPVVFVIAFVLLWGACIVIGYSLGKTLEKDPTLNKNHVLLSAVLTAIFILFIIFQQWRVENIGPKSETILCSDYCSAQGYSGSGMPPRNSGDQTCSCYDSSGKEALKIPLEKLKPASSK